MMALENFDRIKFVLCFQRRRSKQRDYTSQYKKNYIDWEQRAQSGENGKTRIKVD